MRTSWGERTTSRSAELQFLGVGAALTPVTTREKRAAKRIRVGMNIVSGDRGKYEGACVGEVVLISDQCDGVGVRTERDDSNRKTNCKRKLKWE